MADGHDQTEAALEPIALVVAAERDEAPLRPQRGFAIPKIVDYLIVAAFMYFTL